ncbi:MAG: response regulator [Vicinamibacterales bacterium]
MGAIGRYAAVIADVRLTTDALGTGGLDVASYAHERYPELPVVLITSYKDADIDREARRLGAAAVLEKPLPLEVLAQTIDRLVDGSA